VKIELVGEFWRGDHAVATESEGTVFLGFYVHVDGRYVQCKRVIVDQEPHDFLVVWLHDLSDDSAEWLIENYRDLLITDSDPPHQLGLAGVSISFSNRARTDQERE
jgi:hypothetical protein